MENDKMKDDALPSERNIKKPPFLDNAQTALIRQKIKKVKRNDEKLRYSDLILLLLNDECLRKIILTISKDRSELPVSAVLANPPAENSTLNLSTNSKNENNEQDSTHLKEDYTTTPGLEIPFKIINLIEEKPELEGIIFKKKYKTKGEKIIAIIILASDVGRISNLQKDLANFCKANSLKQSDLFDREYKVIEYMIQILNNQFDSPKFSLLDRSLIGSVFDPHKHDKISIPKSGEKIGKVYLPGLISVDGKQPYFPPLIDF